MFLACFFCILQTKYTPMYRNDSIDRNSSLQRNKRPNLSFLENQISLVALLQVSRLNLTINDLLGVLPTGTFYWVNCVLRCVKVLRFTQKHQAAKHLPTWQLMEVLPKHKLPNALTAPTHSCIFRSNFICSQRKLPQWSTFGVWKWIDGPIQELRLQGL